MQVFEVFLKRCPKLPFICIKLQHIATCPKLGRDMVEAPPQPLNSARTKPDKLPCRLPFSSQAASAGISISDLDRLIITRIVCYSCMSAAKSGTIQDNHVITFSANCSPRVPNSFPDLPAPEDTHPMLSTFPFPVFVCHLLLYLYPVTPIYPTVSGPINKNSICGGKKGNGYPQNEHKKNI